MTPDWNVLIRKYSATRTEHPLDCRPDLWVCGYIPEGELLSKILSNRNSRVLDYGCGNGRVSRFLNRRYGYSVTGVDVNPEAIRRAESFRDGIDYRLIEPDKIPSPAVGPFDACICNHVFPTYSSLEKIQKTLESIRAALRSGGPLLVYVDNTNYSGVKYHSFMGGEPTATYSSGDRLPMKIYLDGRIVMEFEDYFWRPSDYLETIRLAGFQRVDVRYPIPDSGAIAKYEEYFGAKLETRLGTERKRPPASIYCARKPRG